MSATSDSALSLIERKKLQWAKEKEELDALNAPWGPDQNVKPFGKDPSQIKRRSSLPPLYKNQYHSYDREKEMGGETSGYGSDNLNQSPDYVQTWHQSGYESSSSRDDRLKWGDKGVGVGKFWQHKEETYEKILNEPPNWVKRGLKNGEILVNNNSPAESPEQKFDEERPQTGSSYSQNRNNFLRGQNIPIDPIEMAERERRRQAALAHQEAIRQQLEDRERRRREEKERRIKEEYEEELRIEREQEVERKRKEKELKNLHEKQERERKRKEAIQEAIELAQKEAQLAKSRKNKQHSNNINLQNNLETKNKISTDVESKMDKLNDLKNTESVDKKMSNCEQLNNTRSVQSRAENLNNDFNNNLEILGKSIASPRMPETSPRKTKDNDSANTLLVSNSETNNLPNSVSCPNFIPTQRLDNNLALIIPTALENLPNNQITYAVLIPATPQPSNVNFLKSISQPDVSYNNTCRTENRVLTPTRFRERSKSYCDSSTQTDEFLFARRDSSCETQEKSATTEKMSNLDPGDKNQRGFYNSDSYEIRNRKDRRSRSESLEERPKWGVNRPPTRYVKQSEKDLLYQRRKLRQKLRETKSYDDKNSSDDSQTVSPRSYRKKVGIDKRHSRSHWRKNDITSRSMKLYQTEIIPLETDKEYIYYKRTDCCCVCRCGRHKCSEEGVKVDILKIDHGSPRNTSMYDTTLQKLPDLEIKDNPLEKLSSAHNGFLLKSNECFSYSPVN